MNKLPTNLELRNIVDSVNMPETDYDAVLINSGYLRDLLSLATAKIEGRIGEMATEEEIEKIVRCAGILAVEDMYRAKIVAEKLVGKVAKDTPIKDIWSEGFEMGKKLCGKINEERLIEIMQDTNHVCPDCEGEGQLWADGKAHYATYQGKTKSCPSCNGSGVRIPTYEELAKAIITEIGGL